MLRRFRREEEAKASIVQADVSKIEEVKRLVEGVVSENSRLDIVVNNAGVAEPGSLGAMTPEHVERIYRTDLFGPIWVIQEAVKHLPKGGRTINIFRGFRSTPRRREPWTYSPRQFRWNCGRKGSMLTP